MQSVSTNIWHFELHKRLGWGRLGSTRLTLVNLTKSGLIFHDKTNIFTFAGACYNYKFNRKMCLFTGKCTHLKIYLNTCIYCWASSEMFFKMAYSHFFRHFDSIDIRKSLICIGNYYNLIYSYIRGAGDT